MPIRLCSGIDSRFLWPLPHPLTNSVLSIPAESLRISNSWNNKPNWLKGRKGVKNFFYYHPIEGLVDLVKAESEETKNNRRFCRVSRFLFKDPARPSVSQQNTKKPGLIPAGVYSATPNLSDRAPVGLLLIL